MAAPTFAKFAAESGHFYDRDGNSIATVPSADGKRQIEPDIRHARKFDLARGCTSVIAAAAKPDLILWLQRQAILAALTLPRLDSEPEDSWLRRIEQDMQETARKAAEEGTRVHAAVQQYLQGQIPAAGYGEHVAGIVKQLHEATGCTNWRSEVSRVSPLGYGAKLDLMELGGTWIVDLKGKDGDLAKLQECDIYPEHWMQLAAQRRAAQLGTVRARCAILFFSRTVPGAAILREVEPKELERGLRMFRALLRYTFEKDNWRPTWAAEQP